MTGDDDFDDVLAIDEMQLDQAWVGQPALFFKYAKMLADERAKLDNYKDELLVIEASLSKKMRDSPEDYGLTKVTDKAVAEAIPGVERYKKKQARINKTKHRVDILGALVQALEHKKRALEKLVDLHGQNYFSSPNASDESKTAVDRATKRIIRRRGKD